MFFETEYIYELYALVMIPPGNVQKELINYRNTLFSSSEHFSAKAYFSYPVLAWLQNACSKEEFENALKLCDFPCELSEQKTYNNSIYISFPDKIQSRIKDIQKQFCNNQAIKVPFDAGIGLFCMYNDDINTIESNISFKAKTWELALLECSFGLGLSSTWKAKIVRRIKKLV